MAIANTNYPDLGAELTHKVIGCAIEVHRELGPGLLESIYEECLGVELKLNQIAFERQKIMPVYFKGIKVEQAFKMDFLIEGRLVVELKAVEKLIPLHEAQILSYMKLSGHEVGLLINFNEVLLKNGIKRVALSHS